MKITKESNKLMSFFVKNNCLLSLNQTSKTNTILKKLYNDIKDGFSYINDVKSKMGDSFYKLKVGNITTIGQIPKPSTFPPNAFPPEVRRHIDENSIGLLKYSFNLFDRNISIIFLTEDGCVENLIEEYNNYVTNMLVWLYIVDIYSSKKCASQLKIFVYHTSLLKNLPGSNIEILNENNVNTAFTRTCPSDSEIVVFRKEEWFKVFMHETFHNFGLDFSGFTSLQSLMACNEKILEIFPVNSEVNLFESYTEFWARIMNALFCSFINMKDKNNVDEFLSNADFFINFERIFAFFQMVKVLDFMGLTYKDIYKKNVISENMRKTMYKEDTNVLSYYVITLILLNNYQDFILWCNINNIEILNFKKTTKNLDEFCKFIEKKYKTKNILEGVECTEKLLYRVKKSKKKQKDMIYLLQNLRMTICEMK
jgi:hypothetical protein